MPGADGAIGPAGRAVRDLELLRARLEREIRRALLSLDTEKGSDALERDRAALATAVRVLRQVDDVLVEQGVANIRTLTQARAIEAVEAVTAGVEVPVDARREMQQIVDGQVRDVVAVFAGAEDEMRQAVNAGITTQGSLADLVEVVAERLETAVSRAASAVDAAVMAAGRRAVVAAAESEGDALVYLYVGPDDRKNRPFCRALVGKAVTKAKMLSLDNGMGLPVADFCGGYGCRHSWAPTDAIEARDSGVEILS